MAQQQWIMVRIRKDTRDRLEHARISMGIANAVGSLDLPTHHRTDEISLDSVINRLLEIREQHAERRAASRTKVGKKGKADAQSHQVEDDEPTEPNHLSDGSPLMDIRDDEA